MTLNPVRRSVADLLARRGLPVVDRDVPPEPPFDPIQWRLDNYRAILAREVPAEFANAQPDHPEVAAWVQARSRGAGSPFLVIGGQVGRGKTWQAWGALRTLVIAAAHANRRCRWRFVTHPRLNDETRPKPDGSHAYGLDPYIETDLLVVDDLGAGKQSEWTADALYRLVDHRWSNHLTTIFTTNLAPSQLAAALDERVVSRLATATITLIAGPDRRRTPGGGR